MVTKFLDFYLFIYRVILRSKEYCREEMPKCLTRTKCVFSWQPEHSCTAIYLVCFNLFMFLFPKGWVFKGSIDKGLPCAIAL
jgi:hypothetical protein